MADVVTARRAADLCGLNERTIRRWIAAGKLEATRGDDGDYRIPVAALTPLRRQAKARASRRGDMAAEIAALRAEVEGLKARIAAMEALETPRLHRRAAAGTGDGATDTYHYPQPSDLALNAMLVQQPPMRQRERRQVLATGQAGDFATRAEAAEWLCRHGIASASTPKSWPGWSAVEPTRRAVLLLALSLAEPGNWRKSWRLHRCDDPVCVCGELLTGG